MTVPDRRPSDRRPSDRGPAPGRGPAPDQRLPPGDRPLADCLDTFWQARIPAAPADPAVGTPAQAPAGSPVPGTVLAELGASGITVRGRPLEAALGPAYRLFTGGA